MSEEKNDSTGEVQETIPCPNCERKTSATEIRNFSGICRHCKAAFMAANRHWILEKPSPIVEETAEHHAHVQAHWDPTADADAERAVTDYLRGHLAAAPPDAIAMASEIFGAILQWCWPRAGDLKTATMRISVLTRAIRPELVAGKNLKDIADELGLTKAAASKTSLQLADALGMKFAHARSKESRGTMRLAQLAKAGHRRRKPTSANVAVISDTTELADVSVIPAMTVVTTTPAGKESFNVPGSGAGCRTAALARVK